jgi:hypothetical protein
MAWSLLSVCLGAASLSALHCPSNLGGRGSFALGVREVADSAAEQLGHFAHSFNPHRPVTPLDRPAMSPNQTSKAIDVLACQSTELAQRFETCSHHEETTVVQTTIVVQTSLSTLEPSASKVPGYMPSTFEDRVKWTVEHRPHLGSAANWARLAGVSDRTLNQAIRRSREKDGAAGTTIKTAYRLALTAAVDLYWLFTGEGSPDLSYSGVSHLDTHLMRRKAAAMLERVDKLSPQEAWWLMRDIELTGDEEQTWENYYAAAREKRTGETALPVVPEQKVQDAVRALRRGR